MRSESSYVDGRFKAAQRRTSGPPGVPRTLGWSHREKSDPALRGRRRRGPLSEGCSAKVSHPLRSVVSVEEQRLSSVLRMGLVADLAMDSAVDEDDDLRLPELPSTRWEAAGHLGRQLGVRVVDEEAEAGDVESTLEFLVRLLDDVVIPWPPQLDDGRTCRELAHQATKNLSSVEVFATLMAGPPQWRNEQIQACKVKKLAAHLKPLLAKGLAAGLNRILGEWVAWDVPRLRDRHRARVEAQRIEKSAPRAPYQRPEGRERADRLWRYEPPGRA